MPAAQRGGTRICLDPYSRQGCAHFAGQQTEAQRYGRAHQDEDGHDLEVG